MHFSSLVIAAAKSMFTHAIRSILTMLGIVIGVAALVAVGAFGRGAEEKLKQQIAAIGTNYIEFNAVYFTRKNRIKSSIRQRGAKLRMSDVESISRQVQGISHISPVVYCAENVLRDATTVHTTIKGGSEGLLDIMGRKLAAGSGISPYHVQGARRVAVLGNKIAEMLFKTRSPLGETILIGRTPFVIIGVLRPLSLYLGVNDPNTDVIIPVTAARRHLLRSNSTQVHSIVMSAQSPEIMSSVIRHVSAILRARHRLDPKEPNDFSVVDQRSVARTSREASRTVALLMLLVAAICLVVGGIGVMNIMLVAVTERTAEIGIRMTLGATRRAIAHQFLLEAAALCAIGGLGGLLLGCLIPYLAHYYLQWPIIISPISLMIAFGTALSTGLIAGYYPARRASLLDPVNALSR